jgi:chromate transporter
MITLQLFCEFFKIGAFTFGGGYAMISMVKTALTDRRKWMDEDEFWECITLAQSLPGVFAINMALYTGFKISGKSGAAAAVLGAALPSMIIIVLVASFIQNVSGLKTVRDIFAGIRPCVIGLILVPGLTMLKKAKLDRRTFWIPVLACAAVCLLGISPVYLIAATIVAGIILARKVINNFR